MGMEVMSIAYADTLPFSFAMGVCHPLVWSMETFSRSLETDEIHLIQLHIHSYKDASGEPVFDSKGCIIGVISFFPKGQSQN